MGEKHNRDFILCYLSIEPLGHELISNIGRINLT